MILYYNYHAWKGWTTDKYLSSYDIKRTRNKISLLWVNFDDWTTKKFYVKNDNNLYVDEIVIDDNDVISWIWEENSSSWNLDNDSSSIIDTISNIFSIDQDKINNLENSLSWALETWTNWFSIWTWWISSINYSPWDWNYWNIINRNDEKLTCDMFNTDWSFAYYSNWSYDLTIDLNWILDLSYWDKVPFLEELLFIPNKILSFITNPMQNIFSTLRVFGWIWENQYCYFWTIQNIEFQKHIKIWTSFWWWDDFFTVWNLTIIDYFILFFLWLPLLIISVRILLY